MERTKNIKRSELWGRIFAVVTQIPREHTVEDAMDAPSAASDIEDIIVGIRKEAYNQGYRDHQIEIGEI